MKNFKHEKGITLIALVITIIVLLILAGVSISTLMGENGILTNAEQSKDKTEYSEIKERAEISKQEVTMNDKIKNKKTQREDIIEEIVKDLKIPESNITCNKLFKQTFNIFSYIFSTQKIYAIKHIIASILAY